MDPNNNDSVNKEYRKLEERISICMKKVRISNDPDEVNDLRIQLQSYMAQYCAIRDNVIYTTIISKKKDFHYGDYVDKKMGIGQDY